MKFSENWLREIIDPKIDSNKLSYQLTMAGLEVDDITKACNKFEGLFVFDSRHRYGDLWHDVAASDAELQAEING
mgnify:CR=1 FL=1